MYLKKISISNFKNIEQSDLSFSQNLNCLVGNNGEGKTNLLDAVHYMSITKSFFGNTDLQNIRHGEQYFIINGTYDRKNAEEKIYCAMKRGDSKVFKRNDKEYSRFSDHVGYIPIVMISPTDISLIVDSGDERRRYINSVISQLNASYLDSLIKYNRVLMQRNKLLKQMDKNGDVIEVLNAQLSEYGNIIYQFRKQFIDDIKPYFSQTYAQVSGEKEAVSLEYKSDLHYGDLADLLASSYEKDCVMQHTTVGIHRDDVSMKMNDYPIKKIGSQGQQKTFLIALKLTQYYYFEKQTGISPILLLDDIFDKLDMQRVERLINLVASNNFGQIFITDSNKTRLDKILARQQNDYKLFEVQQGNFVEIV